MIFLLDLSKAESMQFNGGLPDPQATFRLRFWHFLFRYLPSPDFSVDATVPIHMCFFLGWGWSLFPSCAGRMLVVTPIYIYN